MGICDQLIKQDISANCDDPITRGIEANGVIINRQDIDFDNVVFDEARKNIIKTLPLKSGKKAYNIYVPGTTPFSGTKTALEKGTHRNTFTHDLGFVILDNDPDVCGNIIDPIANGSYVVIYENTYKNVHKTETAGDSAFQVVGFYQGAKAETVENDKYSEDTDGGWSVLLKEMKSPKAGVFMFDKDITTTRTAIDSLTTPVTPPQS